MIDKHILCDLRHIKLTKALYDCIFANWCLCYLNEDNLRKFLQKVFEALTISKGIFIVKETTK